MGERRWLALDGLRGVAVLIVIADHAGFASDDHALGAAGVTIFFVLSGFLISNVVLISRARGEWSMRAFLMARAVRLLPALLVMESVVVAWWLLSGRPLDGIAPEAAASMLYLENVFYHEFDGGIFRHTWSLATEEQFYLLWPLVLPFVARLRRPTAWLAVVILASILARVVVAVVVETEVAYANLPTNAYALLLGCMLAIDPAPVTRGRIQRAVPILGLAAIGWLALGADLGQPLLLVPVGASVIAAVVLASALPGVPILELAWLRFVGRISYALYLWHWPVFVLLGEEYGGVSSLPAITLSLALAVVSTLWIEEPLRRRYRARRASVVVPAALVQA